MWLAGGVSLKSTDKSACGLSAGGGLAARGVGWWVGGVRSADGGAALLYVAASDESEGC